MTDSKLSLCCCQCSSGYLTSHSADKALGFEIPQRVTLAYYNGQAVRKFGT